MEIYKNKLDGKYDMVVIRKKPYVGDLILMEGDKELLKEEVSISFDATFGPDIEDVSKWHNRVCEFVDALNK